MNFIEGFSETSELANERKIADFLLPSAGRIDRTRASVADIQPLSSDDRVTVFLCGFWVLGPNILKRRLTNIFGSDIDIDTALGFQLGERELGLRLDKCGGELLQPYRDYQEDLRKALAPIKKK